MVSFDNMTKKLEITRGDTLSLRLTANLKTGEEYIFKQGSIISFKITKPKEQNKIIFEKSIEVDKDTNYVFLELTSNETKIGELNNEPISYWYEISLTDLNDFVQTIIGYNENGPTLFILNPEAEEGIISE